MARSDATVETRNSGDLAILCGGGQWLVVPDIRSAADGGGGGASDPPPPLLVRGVTGQMWIIQGMRGNVQPGYMLQRFLVMCSTVSSWHSYCQEIAAGRTAWPARRPAPISVILRGATFHRKLNHLSFSVEYRGDIREVIRLIGLVRGRLENVLCPAYWDMVE